MKNILVRSASGLVYVGLIVCLTLWGDSMGFLLLCCLFTVLGMSEFLHITQGGLSKNPFTSALDLFLGLSIPVMMFFNVGIPQYYSFPYFSVMFCAFLILVMVRMVMQLYSTSPNSIQRMAYTVMSMAYVAVPLAMAIAVYEVWGPAMTLMVFVFIWLNDTGAFLVGSAIGSHRLFPRLSPNKSWEGFFGGLLFCIIAAYVAPCIVDEFNGVPHSLFVTLSVTVSVMATWGDLFESMIKRNFGVKDSGNIMPGHGGVLDRIDSLLFVMPATLVLWILFI